MDFHYALQFVVFGLLSVSVYVPAVLEALLCLRSERCRLSSQHWKGVVEKLATSHSGLPADLNGACQELMPGPGLSACAAGCATL